MVGMSELTPPGVSPVPPRLPPELSPPEEAPRRPGPVKLGLIVALVTGAMLVAVSWPVIMKQRTAVDRTRAISSLKQMNLALIDFDNDYGSFPDASTIPLVKAATHTTIPLGTRTSNDYFRQLIAAGNKSEKTFWAKTATTPRKPDDDITGSRALEKGECSYAYVAGLSTSDDPGTPIAMAPMISGSWQFDPKPYGGRAVMLRVDGSVRPAAIGPTGEVVILGKNLIDPSLPYWKARPDLKWPE
jgi:hypothetical protein